MLMLEVCFTCRCSHIWVSVHVNLSTNRCFWARYTGIDRIVVELCKALANLEFFIMADIITIFFASEIKCVRERLKKKKMQQADLL